MVFDTEWCTATQLGVGDGDDGGDCDDDGSGGDVRCGNGGDVDVRCGDGGDGDGSDV